jgi:hypothetical protein
VDLSIATSRKDSCGVIGIIHPGSSTLRHNTSTLAFAKLLLNLLGSIESANAEVVLTSCCEGVFIIWGPLKVNNLHVYLNTSNRSRASINLENVAADFLSRICCANELITL